MNILFASTCIPWPTDRGDRQRIYHILRALAREHRVTLVGFSDPEQRVSEDFPLKELCARVVEIDPGSRRSGSRHYMWAPFYERLRALLSTSTPAIIQRWDSKPYVRALCELRSSEDFDVVWAVRTYIGEMVRGAGFQRIIVDVDDLESVKLRQTLGRSPWYRSKPIHYAELLKLYTYERRLPSRFQRLVVCKEQDRGFFGKHARRVCVIPNGVEDHAVADPAGEQAGTLLFVGRMYYEPNIDAACYLAHEILPILRRMNLHFRLMIVGGGPESEIMALHNGEDCFVCGVVPDVHRYYEVASVVVAPIRMGSGTRLKILEALGRGKAVVASTVAAEGLDLHPGVDFELADTPDGFARACARLLTDAEARRRLGASGRAYVLENYRWDSIGETVNRLVANLDESGALGEPADKARLVAPIA